MFVSKKSLSLVGFIAIELEASRKFLPEFLRNFQKSPDSQFPRLRSLLNAIA